MLLVAGRIGRAHGVRGEVSVEPRTDDPVARFAAGATLRTDPERRGPLTVAAARWHQGRLLVTFEGVADRTAAERLAGTLLLVEVDTGARLDDPDEFYDAQLLGLAAVTREGARLGTVTDVLHLPGQDLLAVRRETGAEALVPFVAAIVPEVDLDAGLLVVVPPPGLLDPDAAE